MGDCSLAPLRLDALWGCYFVSSTRDEIFWTRPADLTFIFARNKATAFQGASTAATDQGQDDSARYRRHGFIISAEWGSFREEYPHLTRNARIADGIPNSHGWDCARHGIRALLGYLDFVMLIGWLSRWRVR